MVSLIEEGAEKPNRIQNQIGDVHAAQARCEVPTRASFVGRLVGKIGKRKRAGHALARIGVEAVVRAGAIDIVVADADVAKDAGWSRAVGSESLASGITCLAVLQIGECVIGRCRVPLRPPDLIHQSLYACHDG